MFSRTKLAGNLLTYSSVRNKACTIGCPVDNQTKKVGCPHLISDIQNILQIPELNLKT